MRHAVFGGAGFALCCALLAPAAAQAATLEYTLADLGGDQWRYDYALTLDAADPAFDDLTVYFDLPGTTAITSFTAPAGWDVLVAQPDPGLPDGGYYDALHLPGLLSGAATFTGFSVSFTAQSGFIPTTQRYELALSDTFQVVYTGQTVAAVPEPESYALLLAGLGVLSRVKRRATRAATACKGA